MFYLYLFQTLSLLKVRMIGKLNNEFKLEFADHCDESEDVFNWVLQQYIPVRSHVHAWAMYSLGVHVPSCHYPKVLVIESPYAQDESKNVQLLLDYASATFPG